MQLRPALVILVLLAGPVIALDAQQATPLQPLTVTGLEGGAARAPGQQAPVAGQQQPPLAPAPVTRLDDRQIHPELDGQRFSLSFSEPRPIIDILRLLVADTSLSLIPDPALNQTFIGELKNVTLREALDLMLEPLGLAYSVQGNVIRVFVPEFETRLYSIDRVITLRSGSRGMSASTGAGGAGVSGAPAAGVVPGTPVATGVVTGNGTSTAGGGSSSTVGGRDGPDLFGEIEEGIRALLSADGTFSLNETAALLQVTDRTSRLDRIEQYVEAVMLRALRQVQIEARVIEVELRDEFSAGINWQVVLGDLTNSVTVTQSLAPATSGAFTLALNIGDFSALLNAFATQGKVNVLSSPRVTAMNNEPAVMRIGTQDVFFTTTTQVNPDTGQILQTTVTPQSITEGVVLSVTSQVSADGVINMSINPSITERTGVATSRLGDTVPIISVRETDTVVRVREGDTIVIAGLMQDRTTSDDTKVPVLGDIPVIGNAFKSTVRRRTKTDLVILLTPTVMGPAQVTDSTARELRRLDTAGKASDRKR